MKAIPLLLIFIFVSSKTFAQVKFTPETTFGLTQGVAISKMIFGQKVPQNLHAGYTGGFVFRYISEPHCGLQVELNYIQKGWIEKFDTSDAYSRKLSYVELPFMSHFEINTSKITFGIDIGTVVSIKKTEKESINTSIVNIKKYYGKPIDNFAEYGVCFGVGIIKKTPIGNFEVGIRGNYSLTSVFKYKNPYQLYKSNFLTFIVNVKYLVNL